MTKFIYLLIISILGVALPAEACTSAIVSARLNPYGRPLLWKHRDTDTTDNKIEYVEGEDGHHSYVALFNASDRDLKEAWMGMNDAGFAIMNTASYNIKDDKVPASQMDKEGVLMTLALQTCRTIEDFQKLLDQYPRPMGVEANFGVIDASGEGAFFETNNHSYKVYWLSDAKDGILIRTNYSHSGRQNEGFGFIREQAACDILQPYIDECNVTPELLTENVSRNFYHALLQKDLAREGEKWIIDQDLIPRYKSTATIVIEGCKPTAKPSKQDLAEYVMWTGMGYPPCAEIQPVWCTKEGVDKSLRGIEADGHSPQCDKVKARRAEVFPIHKGNGDKYIQVDRLFNEKGTGYVQTLTKNNLEVYRFIRQRRDGNRH